MKKLFFSTLIIFLGLALSTKNTFAATGTVAPSRGLFETYTYAVGCSISGCSSESDIGQVVSSESMSQEKYIVGYSPSSDGKQAVEGITPRITNFVTTALMVPPISSSEYVADLGNNIGLPGFTKVQAQGIGYKALSPVLQIWKAFRNLAYSLYIIIFLVIGVMIMLRTKINAQTIISIQNSLPNLLVTLLLITFSYAIAGFVIDLIYLSMYLIVYIAQASNLIKDAGSVMDKVLNTNIMYSMLHGKDAVQAIAARAISGFAQQVTDASGLDKIGGISKPIAFAVIGLGILIGMFKTLWQLMQSYFMIIVLTVVSPLQLLMNGIPGSKSFSNWIRNLLANAAVFPTVLAMLLFGAILMGPGTEKLALNANDSNPFTVNTGVGILQADGNSSSKWVPPFLTFIDTSDVDVPASIQETFMALLGVFIIMMVPVAAQMTRDALKVEQSKYTSEIMAGLGQGYGAASYLPKAYISSLQQERAARLQSKMLAGQIRAPGISGSAFGPGERSK
ncbi:MAG: hypothetical protein WAV40_03070 [Microgenomates group bacterium]